ncbi:MAG TPA: YfiR family protein [Polyangiaceae bacterium]
MSRRALLASGICLVVAGFSSIAAAESPTAPASVQAQIITRILPFERSFAARSGGSVVIVIVERSKDADSASASIQLAKALDDIGSVGGRALRVQTVPYASAASLVAESKKRGALVVYVTPGLAGEVPAIASAFVESGVLTVAAVESYVSRGAVLGVEVADGKPRMSINLSQAKKQKLDFPSAVLKLARIY